MTDYLWLDCEMTGLNNKTCRIIEVAALLTKDDLIPYARWEALVYQNPHVGWEQVAMEMHKKNGLFAAMQRRGLDERDAIKSFIEWLESYTGSNQLLNLAGNSVHFDRNFLVEQWPEIKPFLSHRHLDVSSFKIYAEGQGVRKFDLNPSTHRAMDDIEHSLKEFAYYITEIKKLP